MFRKLSFLLILALTTLQVYAETIVGQISKTAEGKLQLKEAYSEKVFTLKMKGQFGRFMDSYLGYKTYLKFTGDKVGSEFVADRTPVIMSGPSKIEGVLTVAGQAVYIDQQEVVFEEASKVNNYSFNKDSVKSFDNRQVIANGKIENGVFRVSAMVPGTLYSANPVENAYRVKGVHADFAKDPMNYILKTLPQNEKSQSQQSFRGTLLGEETQVKASDYALVITLSGRQGDDLGAANGHFAVGMAKVKEDLTLDMEVHNYYPPKNEKQIIPGFIDYVDYYGALTAGQTNYRPTYTLVIYGESRERLIEMRDALDDEFARLRAGEDNFSIAHNCTTVSIMGLNEISVTGKHQRFLRKVLHPQNLLKLNPLYYIGDLDKIAGQLSFSVAKNSSYYVPRPAFDSLVKNLNWLLRKERLNAFRVDYIFQTQTPSDRPTGGTAANGLVESLKIKLKEGEHAKKPFTPEQISAILNKVN